MLIVAFSDEDVEEVEKDLAEVHDIQPVEETPPDAGQQKPDQVVPETPVSRQLRSSSRVKSK